jgi:hypothetical protein
MSPCYCIMVQHDTCGNEILLILLDELFPCDVFIAAAEATHSIHIAC